MSFSTNVQLIFILSISFYTSLYYLFMLMLFKELQKFINIFVQIVIKQKKMIKLHKDIHNAFYSYFPWYFH